jgi:two-component system, NarL family, sensor histidine kinase DegS
MVFPAQAPTAFDPAGTGARVSISAEDQTDRALVRSLFYVRMAFVSVLLLALTVERFEILIGRRTAGGYFCYFAIIAYALAHLLFIDHPRWGKTAKNVSLALDFIALTTWAAMTGGLASPLASTVGLVAVASALFLSQRWFWILPAAFVFLLAGFEVETGTTSFAQSATLRVFYAVLVGAMAYLLSVIRRPSPATVVRSSDDLRVLARAQEAAIVNEERVRLAREIHDGLGGTLSSLIIRSEYIQRIAKDEKLVSEISILKEQAEEAIDELRRSLTMMRRDFDLHRALEDYCGRMKDRADVSCGFSVEGKKRKLPSEMQLAVFRLLQEALANVQKHARAKQVDVSLRYKGDLVVLVVKDDGVGFDPAAKKMGHYGLENMRARSMKYQGTLDIRSKPGAGSSVEARLLIPSEGSHVMWLSESN